MTKKSFRYPGLTMLFVVLSINIALARNCYDMSGNLIMRNGDFESAARPETGIADSWAEWDRKNVGTPVIDIEDYHGGKKSQKYTTAGLSKGHGAGIRQYAKLIGGKTYRLKFWYKASREGLSYTISEVNLPETRVAAASDWTKVEIEFSAWKDPAEVKRPAGSVNEGGNLYFRTGEPDFMFWIDDVVIVEVEK